MTEKINTRVSLYKLIFIISAFVLLILCGSTMTFSAEKKGGDTGEAQNNIFNRYDREMGRVDEKGIIYNAHGRQIGSVDKNGVIHNVSDLVIGKVESDGSFLNQSGTRLGSVNDKGEIKNVSDRKVGYVKDVSDIMLVGGAARLIFFK